VQRCFYYFYFSKKYHGGIKTTNAADKELNDPIMQMEWNFLPRNATESSSFAISSRGVLRITLAREGKYAIAPPFRRWSRELTRVPRPPTPSPDSDDVTYRVSYDRCSGREVEKRSYVLDTQLSGLYSHGQDITFRLPSDLQDPTPIPPLLPSLPPSLLRLLLLFAHGDPPRAQRDAVIYPSKRHGRRRQNDTRARYNFVNK